MGTRAELLGWARAQVGATSGRPYWRQVMGYESDLDWCAVFVSAALKATGTECAWFPDPVVFDESDRPVIGDAWLGPYDLQPGDPIGFSWRKSRRGDHVGIVETRYSAGHYRTVEGNVSGSCQYRDRWVSDGIIGGIRPEYEEDEVTDADIQKIAEAVWAKRIDYKNGIDDSPHTANARSRLGYIDYITHAILRKLDEIISLLKGDPERAEAPEDAS